MKKELVKNIKKITRTLIIGGVIMLFYNGCSPHETTFKVEGSSGKEYNNYQDACSDGDFDAAHKYLAEMYKDYQKSPKEKAFLSIPGDDFFFVTVDESYRENKRKSYIEAEDYVFNQEAKLLISLGTQEASDRLLFVLSEMQQQGIKPMQDIIDEHDLPEETKSYGDWLTRYNKHCDFILDLAIAQDNNYLAKKILNQYKEDMSVTGGTFNWHISYNSKSKDTAMAKYETAVKSGLLK